MAMDTLFHRVMFQVIAFRFFCHIFSLSEWVVCQFGVMIVDAFPAFLATWNVYRSQWFWLGTDKRADNSATQMKFVVTRFIQMYWQTPSYNLTRMIFAVFLALVIGLVFIDADYASYTGLNSGVGMVYMGALF
ncbi:hypothetical protein PInf_020185 [Phytophthora infestans]|nr:hypothetical protein PInf_020185 [Phytophthora infestans]